MKMSLIFLLGVGMGTILGILVAPEAGKITRRKVREEADRIIDQALAKGKIKHLMQKTEPADVDVVVVEERYSM